MLYFKAKPKNQTLTEFFMRKLFGILSVCCAALILNGKTYYVSVSGSDKNPGSAQAPFATIAFAASKALERATTSLFDELVKST